MSSDCGKLHNYINATPISACGKDIRMFVIFQLLNGRVGFGRLTICGRGELGLAEGGSAEASSHVMTRHHPSGCTNDDLR